jgi:branched-chain amino acid transport system substrate-binding protein
MKFRAAAALVALLSATSAQAVEPIRVGLGLDLTGSFAAQGNGGSVKEGFELAFDTLHHTLGGYPAELVEADTGGTPEGARQVVDRMVRRDKIDFFSGPLGSNLALAVGPTLFAAKVPYLSSNAGPSQLAGAQCNPYFFGTAYQNDTYHEAAGQYASEQGYKRTALITQNYAAGKDGLTGFKRRFKGNVVDEVYVKLGQIDFGAELAQIRAEHADSLYVFLGPQFFKQFATSGLDKDVALIASGFSADQEIIDAVGEAMLGLKNAAAWAHDLPNDANRSFVAAYRERFKHYPSIYAAQAYDVIMAIDAAAREVKGNVADRAAVLAALKKADFPSVRGKFSYGTNNFPIQNYYLRVVDRDASGTITNKLVSPEPIAKNYQDSYVDTCPMK